MHLCWIFMLVQWTWHISLAKVHVQLQPTINLKANTTTNSPSPEPTLANILTWSCVSFVLPFIETKYKTSLSTNVSMSFDTVTSSLVLGSTATRLYIATKEVTTKNITQPDSSWPAMKVSYYTVPLWLLQVGVPLRVLLNILCSYCMHSSFCHVSRKVPSEKCRRYNSNFP